MTSPNLRQFLTVSTGHLRSQDIEALRRYTGTMEGDRSLALACSPSEHGWMVNTDILMSKLDDGEGVQELKSEGFSDEFVALVRHARDNDAWMLKFDADAAYEPGFPVYQFGTDNEVYREDETRPGM